MSVVNLYEIRTVFIARNDNNLVDEKSGHYIYTKRTKFIGEYDGDTSETELSRPVSETFVR